GGPGPRGRSAWSRCRRRSGRGRRRAAARPVDIAPPVAPLDVALTPPGRRRQRWPRALDFFAASRLSHGVADPRTVPGTDPRTHPRTLGALLRHAAHEAPDAEAFRYRGERLTYRDWDALADRLAAGLAARGVQAGDVVALLLPSTPLYLVAYLAAARLGALTTGINARHPRTENRHILARARPRPPVAVQRLHGAPPPATRQPPPP